jgi:hypothetical protein
VITGIYVVERHQGGDNWSEERRFFDTDQDPEQASAEQSALSFAEAAAKVDPGAAYRVVKLLWDVAAPDPDPGDVTK